MAEYIAGGRRVGDVAHTKGASGAPAVARAVALRATRPAAWWGMVMLIASESVLFAAFIGTFFYLRFNDPVWPPAGDPEPKVVVPLLLVALLCTTSAMMQLAWRKARNGRLGATRLLLLSAVAVQSAYLIYEIHDYKDQLRSMPIGSDAYSSIHYVLLGADHAHVFVGILFNLWLLSKFARGITIYRANALQAITWYWHFVNVVTLAAILTLLSAALG